jgi:hypothetical protein
MENLIQSRRPRALAGMVGLGLLLGASLLAGQARAANTVPNDISGVICRPIPGSQVDYGADGVINRSANVDGVECALPMGLLSDQKLFSIIATVQNHHSVQVVACELFELNPLSGNVVWRSGVSSVGRTTIPFHMSFGVPATANMADSWRMSCGLPALSSMGPSQIYGFHIVTR